MDTPRDQHPRHARIGPPIAYTAALARARKVRRRDLAMVERYLAQVRLVASAQAKLDAQRPGDRR
jgi:hypothetical protein